MSTTRSVDQISEDVFWSLMKSSVHTIKPAVITSVDYENACLDATPTTKTLYTDGTQFTEPTVYDVPILVSSANDGAAKISMPIAVGDRCFLLYSDRDFGLLLQTDGKTVVDSDHVQSFGRNPIGALCCFFTPVDPTTIDDTNIVIQNNDDTNITIAPSGNITINTPKNLEINSTADTVINCENATINANTQTTVNSVTEINGDTTINGETVINGNTSIAGNLGVSSSGGSGGTATIPNIVVSDSLEAGGVEVIDHTHPAGDLIGDDGGTVTGTTGEME